MSSSHEQPEVPVPVRQDSAAVVRLGGTGVIVSQFGLGTAFLGMAAADGRTDEAEATVHAALRGGVRYFDTAPLYGLGEAERLLGRVLAGEPRGSFTISSKVGRPVRHKDSGEAVSVFDFSAAATLRSIEDSLSRLRLDRIDVVLVHDPDAHYAEAMAGAFPVLRRLRSEGVVGAIGAGVNHAWLAARVIRDADPDCVLVAGRYTLLDQSALDDLLPLCAERGVAMLAGGVFNSGILSSPVAGASYDYAPATPLMVQRAERVAEVCRWHGVPLKAAALQFPLAHPAVAAILSGCQRPAELEENLLLLRTHLPAALWQDLSAEGLLPPDSPVPSS